MIKKLNNKVYSKNTTKTNTKHNTQHKTQHTIKQYGGNFTKKQYTANPL